MELLALIAIALLILVGWMFCNLCLRAAVSAENRLYFSPAIGTAVCALLGYAAVRIHQPWLIFLFCLAIGAGFIVYVSTVRSPALLKPEDWRLLRFTSLVVLFLYGMQIALYGLFSRIYPGPHEVWSLFNLTGVSPPDQMFAWHQAMFIDHGLHYPQDAFYADMDLYDRPHLGGYITLFFFKLFHLPLVEHEFVYPPKALRFYHCLWWLLNDLYLFGVAPLFKHLFGLRGAILAVASTALGGFFFLCNTGAWMKFSSSYPVLLAVLLFLEGKAPILQAALCATGFYIHGSVLPFLAGFGILQLFNLRYPLTGRLSRPKEIASFAFTSTLLIGAWFVTTRWIDSKQPLFYYYTYGAGLTETQTRSVADIAKAFYANRSWVSVSFLPVHNLLASILPQHLFGFVRSLLWLHAPASLSDFATMVFASQRFCIECALGLVAAPLVFVGCFRALQHKYAGQVALALYLVPTIIVALLFRREWVFSLHIVCLYHTLVLFLFVYALQKGASRYATVALTAISIEGVICVLFANDRFLPVTGLHLTQVPAAQLPWLAGYLALIALMLAITFVELHCSRREEAWSDPADANMRPWRAPLLAIRRLIIGTLIVGAVVGMYSVYCLQFYRAGS